MKRILTALLASSLLLTFAACSSNDMGGDVLAPGENMNGVVMGDDAILPDMEGEDDQYATIVENPFVDTATQPVSTFSADVDTASYAYLRKLVSMGYTLSQIKSEIGKSIRTEELINYFDYEGVLPEEGKLFGVTPTIAACPWNEDTHLLTMTLKTEQVTERVPNNLVFLIDVSGSMNSDDKLGLLKESFSMLTQTLGEDDRVSIVTYSGKEEIVLEGCSGAEKGKILSAVNSLIAGGATNGQAGLSEAYKIARSCYIKGGNNRIIMASDGDLNVGISSAEDLKEYISTKREEGIYLSVLGFGYGNYHDASMEAIADCGNGVYYYIDSSIEAEKVFGTDLLSTLYTVAEDVKLQLTFDPDVVKRYRLIGYENRVLDQEDFEDDTKDAGDLGSGHCVTVCYEIEIGDMHPKNMDWITLDVRYKKPGEDESILETHLVGMSAITTEQSDDLKAIVGLILLSMTIRDSEFLPEGWGIEQASEWFGGMSDEGQARFGDAGTMIAGIMENA